MPALPAQLGRMIVDLSLGTRTEGAKTVIEVAGEIDVYTACLLYTSDAADE